MLMVRFRTFEESLVTTASAPKFFLHIRDRDRLIEDPEGVVAADVDAMRLLAVGAARELAAEGLIQSGQLEGRSFEIADAHGHIHARLPLAEILG